MRCIICNGETIEKKPVEEEIRVNNNIVLVTIEVMVCMSCGERYYDRRAIQYLEEIEKEIKTNRKQLEIAGQILRLV